MTTVADTFVEASDTALASHTPTGPNPGTAWALNIAGGAAVVNAATDTVGDGTDGNGNRWTLTDDLGSANQDVQADVTVGTDGFPGLLARLPAAAGSTGIEFTYNVGSGWYQLSDGTTSSTTTEAAPAGANRWRLLIDGSGVMIGYVGGTEKCRITSNAKSTNTRAGIILGNFSGAGFPLATLDNFQAASVAAGTALPYAEAALLSGGFQRLAGGLQ